MKEEVQEIRTISTHVPTIGRKVWVWVNHDEGIKDSYQAFDGTVIFVNDHSNTIDVQVTDHEGNTDVVQELDLFDPQEGDCHSKDNNEPFATWMPYQKKVMEKEAEAEKEITGKTSFK